MGYLEERNKEIQRRIKQAVHDNGKSIPNQDSGVVHRLIDNQIYLLEQLIIPTVSPDGSSINTGLNQQEAIKRATRAANQLGFKLTQTETLPDGSIQLILTPAD